MIASPRERLLTTAERLFYDEGFHGTGIDRVAAEAGVARMTLYNQFGSKDELVKAMLTERNDRFLRCLDEAAARAAAGDATKALVAAHNEWVAAESRRGCLLVRAMAEYTAHNQAIAEQAAGHKKAVEKRLRHALTRDQWDASERLASHLFLILEGSISATAVHGPDTALRDVDQAVEQLLASEAAS